MKRIISLLLILSTLFSCVLLFAGCDEGEKTELGSDNVEGNKNDTDKKNEKVTLEEQVLVERDGIKITAKEFITDSFWGDGVKLLIENNSDESVSIGVNTLIVNDYMVSDLFSEGDIAAGKKVNSTLYLYNSELTKAGISAVGKIEVYFKAYSPDTYKTIWEADPVTIKTSAFDGYDNVADNAGAELYNENGIKISAQYVKEESLLSGASVRLCIENNTDGEITVHAEELSVNGFMINSYFYSNIFAGKKAIDDIYLSSTSLEENDIENIESIELKFSIRDENYHEIVKSETITINL